MSWSPDLDRQLQAIKALLLDDNDTARLPRIERRVALLSHQLDLIMERETKIMATLDDISADVTAETSMIASVGTLVSGLRQQVADALAKTGMSADDQAKIDAIFAGAEANKAALATALAANTGT